MNSGRKKILWLASWYPNRYDPYDGDFVQRHAQAAALYNDIHVIVVKEGDGIKESDVDWNHETGLTEEIIYFKSGAGFLGKVGKQLKWRKLYLKAIYNYISKYGKPDLLHVHVPWKAGLIALELKIRSGINYIITEHWTIYNDGKPSSYERWAFGKKKALQWIYKHSLSTVTVSTNLGMVLAQLFHIKNIHHINNTVDTSLFKYKEIKDAGLFHFVHVSTLTKQKNIYGLMEACIELKNSLGPSFKLSIVGPYSKDIEDFLLRNKQIGNTIELHGLKTYAEVSSIIKESHSLVLFSDFENSPCVIMESLCCGRPVISTTVGGISELLNPSNGVLINPNNKDELIGAMKLMIKEYHIFNKEEIAIEAQKKYSYESIGREFNKVYNLAN